MTHIASFIGRTCGPGNNTVDYLDQRVVQKATCVTLCMAHYLWPRLCIHFTYIGSRYLSMYNEEYVAGSNPLATEENRPDYF